METTIPNEFYKQAATICDLFPHIPFPDIARVLYEREKYLEKNLHIVDATTGKPVENILDIIKEPEKKPITRKFHGRRPYIRRKRKAYRECVVDGKEYRATTMSGLFKQFGLQEEYINRPHLVPHYSKESPVAIEAEYLKSCLEKYRLKLENYSAYDFDGQFKTIGETTKTSEACYA